MSSDPFAIFRAGEGKHSTLKILWPELYACLAGSDKPEVVRPVHCVLVPCVDAKPRPLAVARLFRFGHPACAMHVSRSADRPGGWPLSREECRHEGPA